MDEWKAVRVGDEPAQGLGEGEGGARGRAGRCEALRSTLAGDSQGLCETAKAWRR